MKEKNIRRNEEGKIIVDRAYLTAEHTPGILDYILLFWIFFAVSSIRSMIKNSKIRRALANGNFTVHEDVVVNKYTESHTSSSDYTDTYTTSHFSTLNSGSYTAESKEYDKMVPGETVWVVETELKNKTVNIGRYPCSSCCLAEELTPYIKPLSESDKARAAQKIAEIEAAEAEKERERLARAEKVTCPSCGKTYRPYKHPNGCPKCGTPRA